jgi:hypothetical protein
VVSELILSCLQTTDKRREEESWFHLWYQRNLIFFVGDVVKSCHLEGIERM